jgi:hypothetical protein
MADMHLLRMSGHFVAWYVAKVNLNKSLLRNARDKGFLPHRPAGFWSGKGEIWVWFYRFR